MDLGEQKSTWLIYSVSFVKKKSWSPSNTVGKSIRGMELDGHVGGIPVECSVLWKAFTKNYIYYAKFYSNVRWRQKLFNSPTSNSGFSQYPVAKGLQCTGEKKMKDIMWDAKLVSHSGLGRISSSKRDFRASLSRLFFCKNLLQTWEVEGNETFSPVNKQTNE